MTEVDVRQNVLNNETEEKPVAVSETTTEKPETSPVAAAAATTEEEKTPAEANDESKNDTEEQVTTVFHDRINYNVKHPLHNSWTLWFDNPQRKANQASWSANLKEIVTVETVEDFWGVYNNIAKVNHLDTNSNYHFFKKGIRPEWEDPANSDGGKFSIQFPRNRTGEQINDYWLSLLLAMIGEQFKYEHEVCGAVVSVRKVFFRIAIWIRGCERNETTETLGRQLKEFLSIPNNMTVEFTPHGESAAKSAQKFTI